MPVYHDPYDDGHEERNPDDPMAYGDRWKTTPPEGASEPVPEKMPPLTTADGLPIPTDALQWYTRAVQEWLQTEVFLPDSGQKWPTLFQQWYQDRASEFLVYDQYGEGPTMWGGWRLAEVEMFDALGRADADLGYEEPKEEPESPRAPVKPATEADVDAALARLHKERLPEEQWAADALYRSGDPTDSFHATRARIKSHTPVRCYCCGVYFCKPGGVKVAHLAQCPACKAAGRKRCPDCDAVFSPRHGNVKRCDPCLTRAAETKARRHP